jgi:Uma2 family endonuclease
MPHTSSMSAAMTHPGPFTWEDFIALDDEDRRELIDGELVEVEVPRRNHEQIVALLIIALGTWVAGRQGWVVLASGYKVRISKSRGVMPDVQLFRPGNVLLPEHDVGLAQGRPDLAVEVISPSSRRYDRVVKARYYATIGVPEYWIVDPEARTVERLVLEGGRWVIATTAAGDEAFEPPTFDGLRIDLRALWGPSGQTPR